MISIGTYQDSLRDRKPYMLDGALLSHKSHVVVPADGDLMHPCAFLIEQEPERRLAVHFHGYAQFQVVVAGSGTLGRHALQPLSVHYAGQRTAYGPILPGKQGLWYLTLRPRLESSAYFMPESRHLRDERIPRREVFSHPTEVAGRDGQVSGRQGIETLIEPETDGLAAWLLRLAPGTRLDAPTPALHGGRFHVVLGGAWHHAQRELIWLSTVWADAHEPAMSVQAGDAGCEVLVVQFPTDACAHPLPEVGAPPWASQTAQA